MGRAEKRSNKRNNLQSDKAMRIFSTIEKAKANQIKLTDRAIDAITDQFIESNVTCIYNALGYVLVDEFNVTPEKLKEIFDKVDALVGIIGTDECKTMSDFKVMCAKKHWTIIGLTDEEIKRVEDSQDDEVESENGEVTDDEIRSN